MKNAKPDNDFCTLLEPILQEAGYTFRFLSEGQFLVHNGDIHFTINQRIGSTDSNVKRVWFENRFKDPRAEEIFKDGTLLIINKLSGIYPEFNVVCSTDGRIRIRYCCDIAEPQDLLPHISFACKFFSKIRTEAEQMLTEMYNEFQANINQQAQIQL